MQSEKLWQVNYEARGFQHNNPLWILADQPEIAIRKAKRFLQSSGYQCVVINKIESRGTIDAF